MKQILIQLDDQTASQLEDVAPGRSHKRSEFVRRAIARALQEELEQRTRNAYGRWPDEPGTLDPGEWAPDSEAMHPPAKPKRPTGRAARRGAAKGRR